MDDINGGAAGIPEDLRCKRTDGKQWRCNALSMPDKTVCEKHYYQAKKRAANSALRASIKKGKRSPYPYEFADDNDAPRSASASPINDSGGERTMKSPALYSAAAGGSDDYMMREAAEEEEEGDSGRSSDSSDAEGISCHQCRRSDRANVVWCLSCDRKGYCNSCIMKWYSQISMEDIQEMCPACRGICSCRVCFNADVLIQAKAQEIAPIDKLRYLHNLLSFVLPVLKQIYAEQCIEIGVETRIHGIKAEIPRAKINADEEMRCDLCKIPIFDYHRHCTNCSYDLCLTCCHDLRRSSTAPLKGDPGESQVFERSKDGAAPTMSQESSQMRSQDISLLKSIDERAIDISRLFPYWKANSDGSIPCGPEDAGGCGSSRLNLRRILKINWAAKLVKNAEEMVSGCKVSDIDTKYRCGFCMGSSTSQASVSAELNLCKCSQRDDSNDNFLYYPAMQNIKLEGMSHFQKHWVKGEPIIVRHVFEHYLASKWDPISILRGIQETEDGRRDDNVSVTVIDCSNQSEIDISLDQFIQGYFEGGMQGNSWSGMLKLRDWPSPRALEEFISCQRPELLSNFPLIEFIHFKWGVLNLAAKLPHDTMQTEVGPKMLVAYGTNKELGRGASVTNLQINMCDLVYLLMHTADVNNQGGLRFRTERGQNTSDVFDSKEALGNARESNSNLNSDEMFRPPNMASKEHNKQTECGLSSNFREHHFRNQVCNGSVTDTVEKKGLDSSYSGKDVMCALENYHGGAIWDVFRRQDVQKLNEYLRVHHEELMESGRQSVSVLNPIYNRALFLNKYHKRKLKEEFRIEPWTFVQHIGEAVFIPAGCPFQIQNLQPSVHLVLDFLSPESVRESARMANEIRSLPNDHEVKFQMLEVGKMSLYSASSAIREIQKITLDPRLSSEIKFEDMNLTAMVSENLERIMKQKQIACT